MASTVLAQTDPEFVSAAEAAKLLGLTKNSVIRRLEAGLLAGYRDPVDNQYRVARRAVDGLLEDRRALREAAIAVANLTK